MQPALESPTSVLTLAHAPKTRLTNGIMRLMFAIGWGVAHPPSAQIGAFRCRYVNSGMGLSVDKAGNGKRRRRRSGLGGSVEDPKEGASSIRGKHFRGGEGYRVGEKEKTSLNLGKYGATALYGAAGIAVGALMGSSVFLAGGAGALTYVTYKWIEGLRKGKRQTFEDVSTGWYFVGNPRSGKTYLAMMWARFWIENGWGGMFASIKGAADIQRFFPKAHAHRVILIQPHGPYPIAINPLQTYAPLSNVDARLEERHRIATVVQEWFSDDMNAKAGIKMQALVYLGTTALLQWAEVNASQVCVADLQEFFNNEQFRLSVLRCADTEIRQAFCPDDTAKAAKLGEVIFRVGFDLNRLMTSPSTRALFGQREGVNLIEIMNSDKWLIVDTPWEKVPDAAFICRTLATMVERLTPHKKKTARGGRPWFAIFDEIQHYATSAFADGISVAPEYGVSWVLIHQTQRGQLEGQKALHAAVNMCGNRFFFQQSPEDAPAICKHGEWDAETLVKLPKRHYRAIMRINNGEVHRIDDGKTPDIGKPSLESVKAILRANYLDPKGRKHRSEIIRKPVEKEADVW